MRPPLTNTSVPYRDFGKAIKKNFEDALMKEVDSNSLKCLVLIAGLIDPSHSEMRLRILNRLNRIGEAEPSPALDDFINERETFVTLRYDNYTMEHKEVNAAHQRRPMEKKRRPVRKMGTRNLSFSKERNPHPQPSRKPIPKKSRQFKKRRRRRCKQVAMTIPDARTYLQVHINGRQTRLQLDTGANISMVSHKTWEAIGSPELESTTIPVKTIPVKTANGSWLKILGRSTPNSLYTTDTEDQLLDMEVAM
ncbi:hypothetical protein ANCDUO_00737 [Ancylostoma duodenale]|uniref:Peptidase A2 domain-containing protein n=1 Tax=Ancylostoma duodenale TaxID=51022 RepID=A0A0C2HBA4_9BILA|nr:hypothetical protein ANCDUO_00737 [Ancylostoma duodenale]